MSEGPVPDRGPAHVRAAARGAFVRRRPGVLVAPLSWDGDVDPTPGPGRTARGPAPADGVRHLWFVRDGFAIEVWGLPGAAGWVLTGALTPPGRAVLDAERDVPQEPGDGVTPGAIADGSGRFTLPVGPGGPVRLVVRRAGRAPVVTGWLLLDRLPVLPADRLDGE